MSRPVQSCTHLSEVRDVEPKTPNGCEECLALGMRWVHSAAVPGVRSRRMLRPVAGHARHEALPSVEARDHEELRARRGLELVLRR